MKKLFISILLIVLLPIVPVDAAKKYKHITQDNKYHTIYGTQIKADYETITIKQNNKEYIVSKSCYDDSFFNGTNIVYISTVKKKQKITSYNVKTKKNKTLKTIKIKDDSFYDIAMIYKNRLLINRGSFDQWKYWLYQYDLTKKTFKKLETNAFIGSNKGKYLCIGHEYRSDVSPYKVSLYKVTSKGVKKIKTLGNNCYIGQWVGNKLYFSNYTNGISGMTLNYVTKKGKIKQLGKVYKKDAEVRVEEYKSDKAYIRINSKSYIYTYSTKKLTKN